MVWEAIWEDCTKNVNQIKWNESTAEYYNEMIFKQLHNCLLHMSYFVWYIQREIFIRKWSNCLLHMSYLVWYIQREIFIRKRRWTCKIFKAFLISPLLKRTSAAKPFSATSSLGQGMVMVFRSDMHFHKTSINTIPNYQYSIVKTCLCIYVDEV